MNVGAWCHVHVQFADRCADENRACEFGRQRPVSPLPDRGATRREGDPARYVSSEGVPGGWMSGPSPTTGGTLTGTDGGPALSEERLRAASGILAQRDDGLHLSARRGDVWVCWCGAEHADPWGHP